MNTDVRASTRAAAVFEKVCKVYEGSWRSGRVVALDDVCLSVERGEVFGLIGPNRAGKTTLVKSLLSICHATSGRIVRLGNPASDRSTLADVGYVHENLSFPRYLTATQVVEEYGRLTGMPWRVARDAARALIDTVGLADRGRETIVRFSKGMLQRLALAQALVNDPKLLVLDEPSEGMDLGARRLLRETIRARRAAGHSVILVSHALSEVAELCDRVAVLRQGRVAYLGTVAALKRDASALPHAVAGELENQTFEQAVEPLYEEASA
jgi:ABC-2 type transport system ATP-binding protein